MTDVMPEELVDLDELAAGQTAGAADAAGLDALDERLIAQLACRVPELGHAL